MVQKYLNKISGPLLDRIDLHVEVTPLSISDLAEKRESENSKSIRERVVKARLIQEKRFEGLDGIYCNAQMSSKAVKEYCQLNKMSMSLLTRAMEKLQLSARAFDRILKVARTIADLEEQADIDANHIAEAIQFRSLDRENWAG